MTVPLRAHGLQSIAISSSESESHASGESGSSGLEHSSAAAAYGEVGVVAPDREGVLWGGGARWIGSRASGEERKASRVKVFRVCMPGLRDMGEDDAVGGLMRDDGPGKNCAEGSSMGGGARGGDCGSGSVGEVESVQVMVEVDGARRRSRESVREPDDSDSDREGRLRGANDGGEGNVVFNGVVGNGVADGDDATKAVDDCIDGASARSSETERRGPRTMERLRWVSLRIKEDAGQERWKVGDAEEEGRTTKGGRKGNQDAV